jgi:predicted PurR-regulated permease PerM
VTFLTVLAVLYTLYFAREFLLPVVIALLLSFLLSPVVRWLKRWRIPTPIGSGLALLVILALVGAGAFGLSGSIRQWATTAPATLSTAETKLGTIFRPLQRVSKNAEQAADAAGRAAGVNPSGPKPTQVVVRGPSVTQRVLDAAQGSLASAFEVLILLYFLLAAGDLFLAKFVKVLPNVRDKRKAVEIVRESEASISSYLLTTTLVNAVEGAVVAGMMYFWGIPSPILWGVLVFFFEFIPYLGAFAMAVLLTLVALTTFDSVGHALLVPASYLLVNVVQGNFVTPLLQGHRLALNPVAIFIGLAFWFWIWGIPGAFIAVPLLATFKLFCDHIESLAAVGEFLGERDRS